MNNYSNNNGFGDNPYSNQNNGYNNNINFASSSPYNSDEESLQRIGISKFNSLKKNFSSYIFWFIASLTFSIATFAYKVSFSSRVAYMYISKTDFKNFSNTHEILM